MSYAYPPMQFVGSASKIGVPKQLALKKDYRRASRLEARYAYDKKTMKSIVLAVHRRRFNNIAERLLWDTKITSSPSAISRNKYFVAIAKMGTFAAREILRRMSVGDVRLVWLIALRVITHADPVPQHSVGIVSEMAQHWIEWGKQEKLI